MMKPLLFKERVQLKLPVFKFLRINYQIFVKLFLLCGGEAPAQQNPKFIVGAVCVNK